MTMKTPDRLLLAGTMICSLLLTACSNTAEEAQDKMENKLENVQEDLNEATEAETRKAYEADRNDVLTDLRGMRDDIERELGALNERLLSKDLKNEKRTEQEALKAELESQKEEIGYLITRVEDSDQGTWISVKEDTRSLGDKIEARWNKMKDGVDKQTDADKDKDGH